MRARKRAWLGRRHTEHLSLGDDGARVLMERVPE
jgi:hypothetical protein